MPIVIDPKAKIMAYLESQDRLARSGQNPPEEVRNSILEGAARCLNEIMGMTDFYWAENVEEKNRSNSMSAVYGVVQNIESDLCGEIYNRTDDMQIILNRLSELQNSPKSNSNN